jgi:hypothetical protein
MKKYLSEKSSNETNKWKAANGSGAAQNQHLQTDQLKKKAYRSRFTHPFAIFINSSTPNPYRSQRTIENASILDRRWNFFPAGFFLIAENRHG